MAGLNVGDLRQRMETELLPRYQQLEIREQRLLLIAAVVLPLLLLVFGLLLPLQDSQKELRAQLAQVQTQAAEAEHLAQALVKQGAAGKGAGVASGNLLTVVDQLARKTQVRRFMTRIKPNRTPDGHEQLMVRMKDAPYDATLRFIHALADHHIGLNSLKLQAADNPGHIHVRAVITGI